jgi:hypothetical protein
MMNRKFFRIMVHKQQSTEEDNIKVNVMKRVVRMRREWNMFIKLSTAEICINDVGYFKILHTNSVGIQGS